MSRIGGTTRASRTWKETVAKEDKITKKSETCFFDRDKARWVEWEKEAETVKEVIGEDAPGAAAAAAAAAKKRFPATKARIFNAVD